MKPASRRPFETIVSIVSLNSCSDIWSPNWFQLLKPIGGVRARPLLRPVETGTSVSTVSVRERVVIEEVVRFWAVIVRTKKLKRSGIVRNIMICFLAGRKMFRLRISALRLKEY